MDEILFIKEYYHYLIVFICLITFITFFSDVKKGQHLAKAYNIIIYCFSIFTVFYLGNREINIGFDTFRYEHTFGIYENSPSFFIRKDPFFDFLTYVFSKTLGFNALLIFCAFIYVFGALYGLKLIFKSNYFLPFLVFLIFPYFMNMGINVIRSGVAASLFLIGIGKYYNIRNFKQALLWVAFSIMFHFSMIIPLSVFFLTRFIKNTKAIFLIWICSIILAVLNINVIANFISIIEGFTSRVGDYAEVGGGESSWINFIIFGFFPVVFAVYFIVIKKFNDKFYTWIVNSYMITHVPYIILINTQFASRIGYLAEFMMPIILMYPLLNEETRKFPFFKFKLCLLLFLVFLIKGYKVLVV
ncbi:EpsG family protein [Sphingobacterium mizutaii]|uniref:EpsG family protein n=1 Tax=Sphingobacterium mizutaii TaxID=1010 RepID=UPI003D95C827